MTINVPRLRAELEYIEQHPEEHDQSYWITRYDCGTTGCLAGNTAMHDGWTPLWFDVNAGFNSAAMVTSGTGENSWVRDVAKEILGINDDQADDLFHSQNSVKDLWWIAHEITDGAIEPPEKYHYAQ